MKKYRTLIIVSVLIALGVVYYYYISTRDNKIENQKSESGVSEVEKIINKNLSVAYPATPREVVDLFSRILTCYYGENLSESELSALVSQSRMMFDDELLNANPLDTYMENLKTEIKDYKKHKRSISTYMVEESADIEYKTFQSHYYAMVDTVYYVKGKEGTERTFETYTLRKDNSGKWKILYWNLTEKDEENG